MHLPVHATSALCQQFHATTLFTESIFTSRCTPFRFILHSTVSPCLLHTHFRSLVKTDDGKLGLYPATSLVYPNGGDSASASPNPVIATEDDATAVPSSVNYRAVATYTARSPRELDFDINEVVRLIEQLSDDWLQVQNAAGDIGIVPSNHQERLYKCVRPLFKSPLGSYCTSYKCRLRSLTKGRAGCAGCDPQFIHISTRWFPRQVSFFPGGCRI